MDEFSATCSTSEQSPHKNIFHMVLKHEHKDTRALREHGGNIVHNTVWGGSHSRLFFPLCSISNHIEQNKEAQLFLERKETQT